MKTIFYLPAHPSYFDGAYTQEQIDSAIALYDRQTGGMIRRGQSRAKTDHKFRLLRAPGKDVGVTLYSAGFWRGKGLRQVVKRHAIDAARTEAIEELQTHVENLRELLYCLEMEMSAECWP